MSPDLRHGYRLLAESLPAGTAIPIRSEHLLALLDTEPAPAAPGPVDARLLTVGEVAARLQVGMQYVYRRASCWPFTRRIGRALRFDEAGFERWLERRRTSRGASF